MQKKPILFITLSFLTTTLFCNSASADIEWSGVYRIEANSISNPELGGKRLGDTGDRAKREMNYGLSHLVLRPKIVAGDGLLINGQFEIFNNAAYPNSQMGAFFGSGVDTPGGGATEIANSKSLSRTQKAQTIQVSQLYLTLTQEYGALVVGRVPLQFGLGITHNAGRGLFDHWYDTDDLVGYKFVVGNLWFMPMLGKSNESQLELNSDDVNDYMVQLQYENPETDLELGVFYQIRQAGKSDAPSGAGADNAIGGAGAVSTGKMDMKTVSLYALKDTQTYRLGMEAAFQSGNLGVLTSGGSGDNVALGGIGIAGEFEYRPEGSSFKWGLKAGMASGDDPNTNAKYEGYLFNRNYDVALLMFNHPLGATDFLRTRLGTGSVRDAATKDINAPDVETISNVMYFAPSMDYAFSDRWRLNNALITGFLTTNPLTGGKDPGKNLGFEWDISLNFVPRKGVMWTNQLGLLFPGSVWKGDGQFDSSFAYGLSTKAAISF